MVYQTGFPLAYSHSIDLSSINRMIIYVNKLEKNMIV